MTDVENVLTSIDGRLRDLAERHKRGEQLSDEELDTLKNTRTPRRFAQEGADPKFLEHLARGGTDDDYSRIAPRSFGERRSGIDFLRDVRAARRGDPQAFARLTSEKGWTEGTPSAGGFLVGPEQLPGYIEARRASSPLRERCAQFDVGSDEVWAVTEGNTITVAHTAEAVTKPDTTGTVAQKISTIFKVAGTTHLSDELLADSNGNAALLVERQFGRQIGIEIDKAIISGTGTGQPTGIRNTAGVTSTAVDGQTGRELHNSVLKALSRLDQQFYPADTVVVHPRDVVKWGLAADSQNRYLFEGGLAAALPDGVELVVDANLPSNLGAGTNETIIIVGAFRPGAYFFSRTPLVIDASQDAGFGTDETVVRGVERYGFAAVVPGAFEILTGITP